MRITLKAKVVPFIDLGVLAENSGFGALVQVPISEVNTRLDGLIRG